MEEEEKFYKVTLADGTVLDELSMNGNNFVSKTALSPDIFSASNLATVKVEYDGETTEYHDLVFVQLTYVAASNLYWFILREKTQEEIEEEQDIQPSDIEFLAEKTLSDSDAKMCPNLMPAWVSDQAYSVGDRCRYGSNNYLYKCNQAHTSQTGWEPPNVPALWVRIDDPAEEWPQWRQPQGAHDAYAKGAKVTHNEKHWISDADNNVWEPGVYGWTESPIEETV